MFIFLFIGIFIIAIALLIIYSKRIYLKKGTPLRGLVVGIQRDTVKSQRNGGTFYYPIVQYTFNGEEYYIKGDGSSVIRHEIGKTTTVLSLPDGPEFVMIKDDYSNLLASIFMILGMVLVTVYYFVSKSPLQAKLFFTFIAIAIPLLAPKYIKYKMKKKGMNPKEFNLKNRTKTYTMDDLKKKNIFWSQSEVSELTQKWNKQGLVISLIFFIASSFGIYYAYEYLQPKQKSLFDALIKNFDYAPYIEALKAQDKRLILFSIALAFFLMMTHSLIYSLRKINK